MKISSTFLVSFFTNTFTKSYNNLKRLVVSGVLVNGKFLV